MSEAAAIRTKVLNYIDGSWVESKATEWRDVVNPATGETIGQTPLTTATEVAAAIESAATAFPAWRRTPPEDRIQPLFKLKQLLEDHVDELGRIITQENGKTFAEGKAELRRAIENVEVACGIPMMMQGYNLEDVARGLDEMMIRQPLGVVAAIRTLSRELSATGFSVNFVADEDCRDMSRDTRLALFRVVQEALTNALRHSGVHEASVTLSGSERAVLLRVEDHGSGFDSLAHDEGLGMLSMRERLVPLGGRLQIQSQPGEGTVVEALVPRRTAQDVPPQAAPGDFRRLPAPTYAA